MFLFSHLTDVASFSVLVAFAVLWAAPSAGWEDVRKSTIRSFHSFWLYHFFKRKMSEIKRFWRSLHELIDIVPGFPHFFHSVITMFSFGSNNCSKFVTFHPFSTSQNIWCKLFGGNNFFSKYKVEIVMFEIKKKLYPNSN